MGIEFDTTQTVAPAHAGAGEDRPMQRLRVPLSHSEMCLVRWTALRSGVGKFRRATPLDEFGRRALFNAVRERITLIASGGGKIPPGVAKDYENWKANLKPGT